MAEGPWWAWDTVDYEEGRVQRLEAELAAARAAALSALPRLAVNSTNRAILSASSAPALMQQGCSHTAEAPQDDSHPMRIPQRPAGRPPEPSTRLRPSDAAPSFSHHGRARKDSSQVTQRVSDEEEEEEVQHGRAGCSVKSNRQVQHPPRTSMAWMNMGPSAAGVPLPRCPAEPMIGCGMSAGGGGGGGSASPYEVGQAVLLHSHSQGCWVEARVARIWPDVSITVTYDDGNLQKHIPPEAQSALLKPMLPGTPASPRPRLHHSKTRRSRGSGVTGMQSPRQHELPFSHGGADGSGAWASCSESAALQSESPRACEPQGKPGILRRGRSSAQRSESRRLRVTFSADSKGGSGFTGAVRSSPRPPASPRHRTRSCSEPRRSLEVPTLSRSRGLTKLPTPGSSCPDSPSLASRISSGLAVSTSVDASGGGQDALLPMAVPGSPLVSGMARPVPPTSAAAAVAAATAAATTAVAAAASVPPLPTHAPPNVQQPGCSPSGGSGYLANQAMLVQSQSQGPPWVEVPVSPAHSTAIATQASTAPATTTPTWQPRSPVSAVAPATSPSKIAEACVVLAGSRRRLPRYGGC